MPLKALFLVSNPLWIFSETTWPVEAKFHVKFQWESRMKEYMNCPAGHITEMATMPVYGKIKICRYSCCMTYFTASLTYKCYMHLNGKMLQSH